MQSDDDSAKPRFPVPARIDPRVGVVRPCSFRMAGRSVLRCGAGAPTAAQHRFHFGRRQVL